MHRGAAMGTGRHTVAAHPPVSILARFGVRGTPIPTVSLFSIELRCEMVALSVYEFLPAIVGATRGNDGGFALGGPRTVFCRSCWRSFVRWCFGCGCRRHLHLANLREVRPCAFTSQDLVEGFCSFLRQKT